MAAERSPYNRGHSETEVSPCLNRILRVARS
jgi:hypothetical protein